MYSWKAIRIVCTLLLLLPVGHLVYLVSRDTLEIMDNSAGAWQRELDAYAAQDARNRLPRDPVVVVGGRRVTLWTDLAASLAPQPVLMRGLGDAIVEDVTLNYLRLVGYYRPCCVVLLPGSSEFLLRDNKSPAELAGAIEELVQVDASHGVTRHFYIFTPIKTPLRPQDDAVIDQATPRLQEIAARDERVSILDANRLLSGPDGRPRPIYFRADGIHLNEHGYLRLTVLLQERMQAAGIPEGLTAATH